MMKYKFLDMILLPKAYFTRLTDKKGLLFAGVLFVGLADLFRIDVWNELWSLINGKASAYSFPAAAAILLSSAVIGFVDVFVFSLPMFDLFRVFKKEPQTQVNESLIRLMKVYISAHYIIVPLNVLFSLILPLTAETATALVIAAAVLDVLFIIWFSAIISNGVNSLYTFKPNFRMMVFSAIFIWNFIWGRVLGMGVDFWENLLKR